MAKEVKNMGASVRARLLNLSKASEQSFDLVLTRFAVERLLFRLSRSRHADRFVLKGAMLLMSWLEDPHRSTRDLDLLGFGDPSPDAMLATFREILAQDLGDGVAFDADALRIDRIREELEYGGLRLRTTASIVGARINLTIDVGFGDGLEPGAELIDYPVMLDLPVPRLRAYAPETVIAEKFQAMVALGRASSRIRTSTTYGFSAGPSPSTPTGSPAPSPPPSHGAGRRSRPNRRTRCLPPLRPTRRSSSNGGCLSRTSPSTPEAWPMWSKTSPLS